MLTKRRVILACLCVVFLTVPVGCAVSRQAAGTSEEAYRVAVQNGFIADSGSSETGDTVYELAVAEVKDMYRNYETTVRLYAPFHRELFFKRDGGRLVKVYVEVGDHVEKGDLLAEITFDQVALQSERERFLIQMRQFEQQFTNEDAWRQNEIEKMQNNFTTEMDETETEIHSLRIAKLELEYAHFLTRSQRTRDEQAKALAEIDEKVAGEQIVAPFSGYIRYANSAKAGSVIRNFTQMIIIDNDETVQFMSGASIDALRYGDIFHVSANNPEISFDVRVVSDPILTDTRQGQYNYVLELIDQAAFDRMLTDNEIDLRLLSATLLTGQPKGVDMEDVLVVPKAAVRTEDKKEYVNLYEDGVIKKRYVKTGMALLNEVQILDGLEAGQQVVLTY